MIAGQRESVRPLVTFGETMALFTSLEPGPLSYASSARIGIGGAESNVAIATRRLGVPACWIGRRGADSLGERVERTIRGEDVAVHAIVDPEAPTGLMIKEHRSALATNVWYYRSGSAGSRLSPADLPTEVIQQAGVLHITGITPLLSASARDATWRAVSIAEAAGIPISFDVNYRSQLVGSTDVTELFHALAARSTIVFASDDEAQLIHPGIDEPLGLARAIADVGPTQVVIKLGARGCAALVDGVEYVVPAVSVPVMDTVGAGDAFVAGYLARLLTDQDAESRLHCAVRTGAFACMTAGDWEGSPTTAELEQLSASDPVAR